MIGDCGKPDMSTNRSEQGCPHYRHIFVYPFFNSMPGRGSVPTVEERRQCITIVYDDLLWNALVVERAPKLPSINQLPRWGSRVLMVSFPSPAQPLNLCMICEEKNPLRFPLLCGFFHFFVHPSGPRLAAPRWVKESYRWSGYDFGLGGEEFDSG